MRKVLCAVLAIFIMLGMALSCNKSEVLIEEGQTVVTDSTQLRVMSSEADTVSVIVDRLIYADEWKASLESGQDWCSISKQHGVLGDTIKVYAKANPADTMRFSFLRIEAGTRINRYRIRQKGVE